MRFYRLEREVVWSILQFMGQTLNLPLNTILVDSYILIAQYHNFSIQQKKIEKTNNSLLKVFQNGRLYKIIVTSLYLACKMNDVSISLDTIFTSLVSSCNQAEAQFPDDAKINVKNVIELTSNENEKNKKFVQNENGFIELTDAFKYELVCTYEHVLLNSINFSPTVYTNPFRYIKSLSKNIVLGSFQICEKVTYFILMILKSNIFLSIPVDIIVAAATEAAYICSDICKRSKKDKMSPKVEEWIKASKSQNFPAFENAISICCS